MLDQQIEPLDVAVKEEAQRDKMALLLQTQPGVGSVTALAYVLTMGDVKRFARGGQASILPADGRSWVRLPSRAIACCGCCWLEAAQIAVRYDPGLRKEYLHRCHQKPKAVAKVVAARKLAV